MGGPDTARRTRSHRSWAPAVWLAGTFLLGACARPPVLQPIDFSHAVHAERGLDCKDCHQHFQSATFSGLPGIDVCMDCHEDSLSDSPEEEKLRAYGERHEDVPWQRLHVLPDHVYHSHRRHVVAAELSCDTCHGDTGTSSTPPTRPLVDQTMDWCIDCHARSKVTTECIHCHR